MSIEQLRQRLSGFDIILNILQILSVRDSEYRAVEVKTRALEQRCGEAQEAMTALEEKDKERVEVLRNSELVLAQRTANLEQLNQQVRPKNVFGVLRLIWICTHDITILIFIYYFLGVGTKCFLNKSSSKIFLKFKQPFLMQ